MCDDLLVWLNKKKKGKHEIVCNYVQCCVEVSEICCCCCFFFDSAKSLHDQRSVFSNRL